MLSQCKVPALCSPDEGPWHIRMYQLYHMHFWLAWYTRVHSQPLGACGLQSSSVHIRRTMHSCPWYNNTYTYVISFDTACNTACTCLYCSVMHVYILLAIAIHIWLHHNSCYCYRLAEIQKSQQLSMPSQLFKVQ